MEPFQAFIDSAPKHEPRPAAREDSSSSSHEHPAPQAGDTIEPSKRAGIDGVEAAKPPSANKEVGELGDGISEELRAHRQALRDEFPFQDLQKAYNGIGLEDAPNDPDSFLARYVEVSGEKPEEVLAATREILWDLQ